MINRNIFQNQKSLFSPPLSMMHDGGCRHMSDVVKIIAVSQQNVDGVRLCCRIVLKLSLTGRRRERSEPWSGAAVRSAPQRPCPLPSNARRAGIESRDEERKQRLAERSRVERSFMKARANRLWIHAAFAATHVAAHAGTKPHVTHSVVSTIN